MFIVIKGQACYIETMVQEWTISQLFKNFQGHRKILESNKLFFKDQGYNQFWEQIKGKSLALKDIWQPYFRGT